MSQGTKRKYSTNTVSVYSRDIKKRRFQSAVVPRAVQADYRLYAPVRQEFKVWDYSTALTVTSSGQVDNMATVGAGGIGPLVRGNTNLQQFLGNNISIVGVEIKYTVIGAQSNAFVAADLNNTTRVMMFQWMDSSTPIISGVLQNSGDYAHSAKFLDNRENLNVVHDEIYGTNVVVFNSVSGYANSNVFTKKSYIKGKKFSPITFDTSTPTYQKGGLYWLVVNDSAVTPHTEVNCYVRITFNDT